MKVTIPAEQLQAAAAHLAAIGNYGGDHIAITTGTDRLVLSTAGDCLAVRTGAPATVNDPGTVLVPAPAFLNTVGHLVGTVEVTDETDNVSISDRAGTTALTAVVGAVAPVIPDVTATTSTTFSPGSLARMVRPIRPAIEKSTNQPGLGGICFDAGNNRLRLVATDARRLAVVSTDLPALDTTPLVPPKVLLNALKALDPSKDVTATADRLHIRFTDGTTEVTLGLIQAPFPAWENLVKITENASVTVPAHELRSSVARVAVVLQSHEPVVLTGSPSHGLAISAAAADTGSAQVAVTGASVTGTELRFGMNHRFLLEALGHTDGDVTLTYQAPDKGVRCQVGDTMWFLMPIRV